ncbi:MULTISPECIES: PQQ-binding-like beta-propeller repeat protein [Streptomyces]|uniref:PQQ-binding-like beta-propeller repeat protein n=1 Tax=Streptomyces pratisoli TaxID=3139917 RepID=A0ACC6QN64_9ACTN|nr:PQQ-binding-like beta-propeller repeat protein [Streptomyces sp. NBC_00259]
MEPLQDGDPRRVGPYTTLGRLRVTASTVQYLARAADIDAADGTGTDAGTGAETDHGAAAVVVSLARDGLAALPAFRGRFEAEARTAERLAGGWVPAPVGTSTDGPELWTAYAYVPAVTLGEAIALVGPLPERTVRVLGAGLAETLSRVHATGTVLHGLAPETVLLAADGPRLTAFGALGAAAHAEPAPGGGLSVRLGYLTPEQLAGEKPGTASDVFVLGLLLAYAATGTTPFPDGPAIAGAEPGLDGVPDGLRDLVAACLAKSPAARPTAGSAAATLALEGAAALAKDGDGWLPQALPAALADQAGAVSRLLGGPSSADASGSPTAAGAAGPTPGAGDLPAIAATPGGTTPQDAVPADFVPQDTSPAESAKPAATDAAARRESERRQDGESSDTRPEDGRRTLALGAVQLRTADRATAALGLPRALPPAASGPPPQAPGTAGTAGSAATAGAHVPAGPAGPSGGPAEGHAGSATVAGSPGTAPAAPPHAGAGVPAHGWTGTPQPGRGEAPAAGRATAAAEGDGAPKSVLTASVLAAKAGAERRAVVLGGVAGAVGLLVGGGVGAALAGGDEKPTPPRPGPSPAPGAKPLTGVPPTPLWAYRHAGSGALQATAWRDRVLAVADDRQCTGVDLRTGRKLWTQPAAATAGHAPVVAGDALFVIGATHFVWLSPQDGAVRHRAAAPGHVSAVAAADGAVVWFTGTSGARTYLFAYDAVARKELWRAQVPNGRGRNAVPRYQGVVVRPDGILVRQDSASLTPQQQKVNKGRALFALYDRPGGKRLWGKYFGTVHQGASVSGDPSGRLYAAAGDDLHAYDTRTGKHLWRAAGASGEAVVRNGTLYVPTPGHRLYALDAATGASRWTQSTEAGGDGGRPRVLLSAGGRTALVLESTQVTAFTTADGGRLWKFQDAGGRTPVSGYRAVMAGRTAVVWRDRAFYALPIGG